MEKDRVMTINSLKGIAILGVVMVHYGSDSAFSLLNAIVANGARGVQLLFVINGYLIFRSLDKIELTSRNIINWWKNKFLRIIPLYWFFTGLHLLIFGTGSRYYLGPLDHVSVINIICNLLFLHNFFPYYNCINANWFMGVIGIFYVVAPFLKRIVSSLEKAICLLCFVLPVGYLLMHISLTNYHGNYPEIWADYVKILSFPSEFPCLCIGIIIFYLEKNKLLFYIKNRKIVSICLLFLSLWGCICLINDKHIFVIGNNISTFGILFGGVFISQMIFPIKIVCNEFFAYVGKHSYGIYLSHLFLLKLVTDIFYFNRNNFMQWVVGYICVLIGALTISLVTEKLFEQNKLINYLQHLRI